MATKCQGSRSPGGFPGALTRPGWCALAGAAWSAGPDFIGCVNEESQAVADDEAKF
jgi:hypothetical protein